MEKQEVVVTDIQMPFGSMIVFMLKWSLASIPAFLILAILFGGAFMALGLFGGALSTLSQ